MKLDTRIIFIGSICIILICLELLVANDLVSAFVFSRPSRILQRLWEMLVRENLAYHLMISTFLSVVSAIVGFAIGTTLAFLMLALSKTRKYAEFILDFVRSIPLTTLIPIFIAIYGIGNSPKVAIGAVSAALTAGLTVYLGLRAIQERRKEFITLYRPTMGTTIRKIYLVDGRSVVITGIRLSISIALILIIVSEMFIGTEAGIGRLIMDKSYTDDRAGQYAAVLMTGIIGWSLNKVFDILQPNETNNYN